MHLLIRLHSNPLLCNGNRKPHENIEQTDRWRTLKQPIGYRPSSSGIAIEGLGLFLKDQRLQSLERDVIPSRSESAPPSIEGSLAVMENIFPNRKSAFYRGSACASISGINHENTVRFHGDGSLGLPRNSLPAHEEECDHDRTSEQSASVSVEKAGLSGYHSRSLDSMQDDCQTSSPSYDQYCTSNYKSVEEKVVSNLQAHFLHNNSVSISSVGTSVSCSVDDDVNSGHIHVVKSADLYKHSDSDSLKAHRNEQLSPQYNALLQQAASQESNTSQAQDSYAQITYYPGINHAYGGLNQFHCMTSPGPFHHNLPPAGFVALQYITGGYNLNSAVLPSYLPGYPHQSSVPLAFDNAVFPIPGVLNGYDMQNLPKFYGRVGVHLQLQPPFHLQYFQPPLRDSYCSYSHLNHQTWRDGAAGVNQVSSYDPEKGGEFVGLSNDYSLKLKGGNMSRNYYFGIPENVGPLRVSPAVQSKPAANNNLHGRRYDISASKTNGQSQNWKDMNSHSFLEELRCGRGQRLELSDIEGYIVEFSVDQHGSRFIQQKLETCTAEEKASIFKEVVPNASKLVTDVFGNYVVQKLFEHGTPEERMNLANQLQGQILPLSLQMYGCRVMQKALDVIDLEQKTMLVRELNGHILTCVRDQNGNHVIQKCIESIPTDHIHFIISSFRGQVAKLSMHPYGCRVIQRFLEHCNDNIQTQFIVDEILDSVCSLAQDQYGNYVTQHVLERGKPHERSQIIVKLAGSVVQLSQHKFASNVIEKCVECSDSTARGMLIKEIIGDGDKNDNLLIMMKDRYANYVIQRILEKCSSDHREVLLSQIRTHLTALKKYTYGKYIVARIEHLCGDGLWSEEATAAAIASTF